MSPNAGYGGGRGVVAGISATAVHMEPK
jgi:hypothetical protein